MPSHASRHVVTALLCVGFLSTGCPGVAPRPSIADIADRFVADLGVPQGAALSPWFRSSHPVTLRRRCPDCPASRRLVESLARFEPHGRELGAKISDGPVADERADVAALRIGPRTCRDGCCTWSVGLLDHGATHLERACFAQDQGGPYLTTLTVIDG